nr:unnamed protein product [Amyelois transitella]
METNVDTPYKLLCTACLCFGRSLQPLRAGKLNQCYLDIIKEIPLYNTPIQCPSVCLECSALLRKVVSFREQVQDSYRILQAYTSETLTECLLTDVTRPPKLRTHILESIDIMPMNHVTDIAVHKEASMKSELKNEFSIGNYSCPICNTVLPTLESFQTHYRRHMRRYECSMCQRRTLDLKVMEQHYYSTHRISLKQYPCSECAHVSNSIDLHRYHKDTHKARVQCPDCDKSFIHRAGLMNHRLAVHELNNKFPCTICDKVFRWKTSLKRHLEKHDTRALDKTASNVARCETCKINFASECSYKRHMKNSLKHPSKNRVGLDQHIRNVHKGRPNDKMCHHCGKGFPTKVQLESHIRTHTGERPFICEFCPTMFSQQSNLYKHNRQVHLNMKSKRYPMCKKRKDEQTPEAAPEAYRHVLRKRKEEQPPDVTNDYRPAMSVFGHYVDERYCPV